MSNAFKITKRGNMKDIFSENIHGFFSDTNLKLSTITIRSDFIVVSPMIS